VAKVAASADHRILDDDPTAVRSIKRPVITDSRTKDSARSEDTLALPAITSETRYSTSKRR
jgi:hypothetical protein